ncbi:5-deoxy-glucuronate isomerase [Spirochaetota bacterium]|nr:5-deoxy-glucuronate isomerase [Spirochaetota bacterium]
MEAHLKDHRNGFSIGYTPITTLTDITYPTGIELGVLKLQKGNTFSEKTTLETAYLLMHGCLKITTHDDETKTHHFNRTSLFNEAPSCIHLSTQKTITLIAESDIELTVYKTTNPTPFPNHFYDPSATRNEHRGKGLVGDTSYRFVRTIFDKRNAPPEALLVLGEVITFPGRWSSYPPHHHTQPEIYHYRFDKPAGYGHSEWGENVFLVKAYDTVKIVDGVDHAQCAAPGYAMYYSWVIRHLPDDPYLTPTFTQAHDWTQQTGAAYWQPTEAKS